MTREEAIENLKILKDDYWDDDGYGHETKQYDDTMLALDMGIESLEQEPKWTPVTEKLPEEPYGCLVTVETDDRFGEPQRVLYPEFVGYDGETWNLSEGIRIPFEVVAWQPLPMPYKESEEV